MRRDTWRQGETPEIRPPWAAPSTTVGIANPPSCKGHPSYIAPLTRSSHQPQRSYQQIASLTICHVKPGTHARLHVSLSLEVSGAGLAIPAAMSASRYTDSLNPGSPRLAGFARRRPRRLRTTPGAFRRRLSARSPSAAGRRIVQVSLRLRFDYREIRHPSCSRVPALVV